MYELFETKFGNKIGLIVGSVFLILLMIANLQVGKHRFFRFRALASTPISCSLLGVNICLWNCDRVIEYGSYEWVEFNDLMDFEKCI